MISRLTAALLSVTEGIEPFVDSLGLTATLILTFMLITREFAAAALETVSPADFPGIGWVNRVLNIGIIPFLLIFVLVMFIKIMSVI